eukprot:scaffold13165_cov177-Amphora_coffeaeformis.AAC.10
MGSLEGPWGLRRNTSASISTIAIMILCQDYEELLKWNVLEFGSGTGAVGILAAGLGFFQSVHLTEHRPPMTTTIPSIPDIADRSMDWEMRCENGGEHKCVLRGGSASTTAKPETKKYPSWPPRVHELDWSVPEHSQRILLHETCNQGFDSLLASDVAYVSELPYVPGGNDCTIFYERRPRRSVLL